MACRNPVDVVIQRKRYFDPQIIQFKCGNTDHHGYRVTCDSCLNNPQEMQAIRNHQANADADNAWNRSAGWGEM